MMTPVKLFVLLAAAVVCALAQQDTINGTTKLTAGPTLATCEDELGTTKLHRNTSAADEELGSGLDCQGLARIHACDHPEFGKAITAMCAKSCGACSASCPTSTATDTTAAADDDDETGSFSVSKRCKQFQKELFQQYDGQMVQNMNEIGNNREKIFKLELELGAVKDANFRLEKELVAAKEDVVLCEKAMKRPCVVDLDCPFLKRGSFCYNGVCRIV